MRKEDTPNDWELCRAKIQQLLIEYNCELTDPDEGYWVLIRDKDTGETGNAYGQGRAIGGVL